MPTKPVLLALVAIALVGCSSTPAAAPSASTGVPVASSSSVASVAPSTPASAAPSVAPSPSAAAEIDLATALPKTAGGYPLDTKVVEAASIAKVQSLAGLKALLEMVGATDAKVVVGWGGASQGEQIVTAIQIPGASPTVMKAFEHTLDPGTITMGLNGKSETVGGKAVLSFAGPPPTYVYIT